MWRFRLLIGILSLGCLIGRVLDSSVLDYIFKPLLMPALALLLLKGISKPLHKGHYTWLAAVFFCWLGDVFLMLVAQLPEAFLMGLGSFFVAHSLYIGLFLRQAKAYQGPSVLQRQPLWLLPILALGLGFYASIYAHLEALWLPVLLYAFVLMAMSTAALHRVGRCPNPSGKWVLAGALLFLFSDLLIGINKFAQPLHLAGFGIMLTYITGQWLIAEGLLQLWHKSTKKQYS